MSDSVKQVIVMRHKYLSADGKEFSLRKGKMIAQACHASMSFLTRRLETEMIPVFTKPELDWMAGSFAKVCVRVNSEEELLKIHDEAKKAGLEVYLITDSGRTEFHGVPTNTCLAIGPDLSEKIDPITGSLQLL